MTFSPKDRAGIFKRLETETFDLVVIGGGITGAGVARDAASRGMKVALVEANDFAYGTSSRSSKLIHGGIRYLENMEFGLVFEALSERRLLFDLAPHLVHPLRFLLPLYKGGRVGMFKMGLGMWLYDALSMFEAPELHERLDAKESSERFPQLQRKDLLGSYVYSDAYMDDDRLVHETLRAAVKLGAACINYVSADGAQMTDGKVSAITCTENGRKFQIKGRHFVSTVGPWTDTVANNLLGSWKKILRPSKGIHLTFDRARFELTDAVVMAADQEKRIVFGIPRHEMVIVGTTDTDFSGDPADAKTTAEDVKYVLNVASQYFPGAKLTADDVISSYVGVRPLVDDGAATESKTSREHIVIKDPRNITFVAGGKYTTYRLMAQQTVVAALESFSIEDRVRFKRGDTKRPLNDLATRETLDDSLRMTEEWGEEFDLPANTVRELVLRHGAEALLMLETQRNANYATADDRMWAIEAYQAIHETMCMNLIDFYVRRSPLFLARRDHGRPFIETLSRVFAQELSWSDSKRQEATSAIRNYIEKELAWKQNFGISPSSF